MRGCARIATRHLIEGRHSCTRPDTDGERQYHERGRNRFRAPQRQTPTSTTPATARPDPQRRIPRHSRAPRVPARAAQAPLQVLRIPPPRFALLREPQSFRLPSFLDRLSGRAHANGLRRTWVPWACTWHAISVPRRTCSPAYGIARPRRPRRTRAGIEVSTLLPASTELAGNCEAVVICVSADEDLRAVVAGSRAGT